VDAKGVRGWVVQGDAAGGGTAHFHRFSQNDGQRSIKIEMGYDGPCGSKDVLQVTMAHQDSHGWSLSLLRRMAQPRSK
jgi:hypothetical protein